jgi:preprotein translocase subunit SecG
VIYLLYTIHVLVCLFLILVVLLQQGKGADLSVFGGGATQAAFGARGAVSLLHKLTVWGFVAFIVTTVSIGFLTSSSKSSSVLSNVPAVEESAVEESTTGSAPAAEAESTAGETGTEEGATPPAGEEDPSDGTGEPEDTGESDGGE